MFWYFPKRWNLLAEEHSSDLTQTWCRFSNVSLVTVWEGERERNGQTCKEVTTVYSSAHTINPWARLCVPLRHTDLRVLLPSLKASTEADSDYCAAGRVERWKRAKWKDEALPESMSVPLPSVELDSLKYCIYCLNYGSFEPAFCLRSRWLMVTSSFMLCSDVEDPEKENDTVWLAWIGSLEASVEASCYWSFYSVDSSVITASRSIFCVKDPQSRHPSQALSLVKLTMCFWVFILDCITVQINLICSI